MSTLIFNAEVYTPLGILNPGWVWIENRKITRVARGSPAAGLAQIAEDTIDAAGHLLLPGMIDLHVHGAMGYEIMDGSIQAVQEIARFLARHGVTAFLGATWTATDAAILKALDAITATYGRIDRGAALLGAYLEGPFLNPNRAGAQDINLIRQATDHEKALLLVSNNLVRIMAIAPEYPENIWLINACTERGITVAAGHTAATYAQMEIAVQRGVRQLTHCFNAMTPLHHREPGVVGAGLTMPQLRCELIADNIHVHPVVQRILYQARGVGGILLVSDCTRVTGFSDGDFILDNRPVQVRHGAVRLMDGTLAGSTLTLDKAVHNFSRAANIPLADAILSASLYPAQAIGVDHQKGSLEPGKDADMFLMDDDGEIFWTMVAGEMVHIRS
ncbi:MAG: N-acetylglucosamine-6-phosphate deacetylase [Bellilinea sp.]|jgi:N-acetylglucosamine-6-phosphate deacetylase